MTDVKYLVNKILEGGSVRQSICEELKKQRNVVISGKQKPSGFDDVWITV